MQTNKTDWLKARATPIERRALEAIAAQERRKLSETLREIVREAAKRRGVWDEAVALALGEGGADASSE